MKGFASGVINRLIGNVLELARRIGEFLPNLVGKLVNSDQVAYTEANAHSDIKYGTQLAGRSRHIQMVTVALLVNLARLCG